MTGTVDTSQPPLLTPDPLAPQRRRRRSLGRRVLLGAIMLLVLGVVAYFGYFTANGLTPADAFKLLVQGVGVMGNKMHPTPPFGGKDKITILLLGTDVSFDDAGTARSDTIKLITVEVNPPRIAILSIPRDTWVEVPGHNGRRKINAAYQLGGPKEDGRIALASETVANLLHDLTGETITIDHFLRVQTGGFVQIIDKMGGIDINVEKKMDYEDPSQELFIHLTPGMQHLDGNQAMGYVRFRHDAESDFGRIRRQDQLVEALIEKMKDPNQKMRMVGAIAPAMKMLKTDLTLSDMMALKELATQLGKSNIQSTRLPTTDAMSKAGASIEEVTDTDAAALAIHDVLHGPRPTVVVLNGTKRRALADIVGKEVDANIYNVIATGTAEAQPTTMLYTGATSKSVAESLATALGLPLTAVQTNAAVPIGDYGKLVAPTTPPTVTVVLGSDYSTAPKAPTAPRE